MEDHTGVIRLTVRKGSIRGGGGNDTSGDGPDLLHGNGGNDALNGGPGIETCFQDAGSGPKTLCEQSALAPMSNQQLALRHGRRFER